MAKNKNSHQRIVVISPCRNEEATVNNTIRCMEAQTVPPVLWVIVDDGSSDHTPELLEVAARRIPWIRIVRREDRGYRKVGGGVIEAFNDGLRSVNIDYDYIVKMDVDLEFPERYFEKLLTYFDNDPDLAAASGKVFRRENGKLVEEFIIDEMVSGAFKFFRRECFEKIGGFVAEVEWDGIDFHTARMAGYRTGSYYDPDLQIIHLRLMGSTEKNIFRGRMRWGRGQWFMGSSFPYIIASGLFRMHEKPYIIGGLLIIAGYIVAAVTMKPRYNYPGFRKELHRWQYKRLLNVIRGRGVH